MLTVNINDSHLEKRIAEKARLIGKSTQELVKDLLADALLAGNEGLDYQKLNPKEHGYLIDTNGEEDIVAEETVLFSHVEDTAAFVDNLRKNTWRKS
ncbi:hypothetical protein [Pseudopedobacter beijingensis]|uniref:Ribbon-helix-helix protein, copG family n=1 Tax=Pseudopedobacter beijingensis TaxID=1207056 RepID=A0ABW4I6X2_9SPHI